jgi:hypothetical protein
VSNRSVRGVVTTRLTRPASQLSSYNRTRGRHQVCGSSRTHINIVIALYLFIQFSLSECLAPHGLDAELALQPMHQEFTVERSAPVEPPKANPLLSDMWGVEVGDAMVYTLVFKEKKAEKK